MGKYLLEVKDIKKSYNGEFRLPAINFNLKKGEILTVIGSNGSGKTTLSNLITGLLKPDSGEILYGFSGDPYRSIGYAPEFIMLWPGLTPLEQILIVSSMYNINDKKRSLELMSLLSLEKYKDKPISELSNGNKKKLNFILAVLHNPLLLVLDEPFNSLDPVTTEKIINWLKKYVDHGERGVIITTNRPDIIATLNIRSINLDRIECD